MDLNTAECRLCHFSVRKSTFDLPELISLPLFEKIKKLFIQNIDSVLLLNLIIRGIPEINDAN